MKLRILFLSVSLLFALSVEGQLRMPRIFGDQMVLQRGKPIPLWGHGKPNSYVVIDFQDKRSKVKVGADGRWRISLSPRPAGGPFELRVSNEEDVLIFREVLIGEVWLASGQSNMEWTVPRAENGPEEVRQANFPEIRFFLVTKDVESVPREDLNGGGWSPCDPNSVRQFSAAAYFFARNLHLDQRIPVGIIQATWGGTIIESWMDQASLMQHAEVKKVVEPLLANPPDFDFIKEQNRKNYRIRDSLISFSNEGLRLKVNQNNYSDRNWPEAVLPEFFDRFGLKGYQGYVWFRKEVTLSAAEAARDYDLVLGRVQSSDITYVNGREIGRNDKTSWERRYRLPRGLLRAGSNLIAVRVLHTGLSGGGIYHGPLRLQPTGGQPIALSGPWRYNAEIEPALPTIARLEDYPGSMYNAMIAPLGAYAMRGFLWYQGESNAVRAREYRDLFPLLIRNWRIQWREWNMPFLYVQLANYREPSPMPLDHTWAELREAQAGALRKPNTGMAVAIDIGDPRNIHPSNKQEVGRRLYLAAQRIAYHRNLLYSGPLYRSMRRQGNRIIVKFRFAGAGLKSQSGEKPVGFAIAGSDGRFYWAEAEIVSADEVAVYSEKVPLPVAVRYAWDGNPHASLYNSSDLPASPFKTDSWPWITAGQSYYYDLPAEFLAK